jgi:hypothetical protein
VTSSAPLIIGATGGSGTRVVARLAQHAGYFLGSYVNDANDALAFRSFHDQWINRFLSGQGRPATGRISLPQEEAAQMTEDFHRAVEQHISKSAADKEMLWGWKAPRSIYLLPFLQAQYPGLKFIHLLRDGRDMAFSKNQNQLRKHGAQVLRARERWFNPEPVRSILLWARVNLAAAQFGETQLRETYLAVRFEDLCAKPVETTARITQFLGVDLDVQSVARAEIAPPPSMGRWRRQPSTVVSKLEQAARAALQKFGYLETSK